MPPLAAVALALPECEGNDCHSRITFASSPLPNDGFRWLGLVTEPLDWNHDGLIDEIRLRVRVQAVIPGVYEYTLDLEGSEGESATGFAGINAGQSEIAVNVQSRNWAKAGRFRVRALRLRRLPSTTVL